MGNEEKIKKRNGFKVFIIFFIILLLIISIAVTFFVINKSKSKGNLGTAVLENPMKKIVESASSGTSQEAIVQKGVQEFNQNYINYILLSLGVGELHSFVGYGNPVVELNLDGEVWSSEIINGTLNTIKAPNANKDLVFSISKEDAVKALLSNDIRKFMKDSVANGVVKIQMVAGKPELLAKGYLDMYQKLAG